MGICISLFGQRKKCRIVPLLLIWAISSVLGVFFAYSTRNELIPMIRYSVTQPVSLSGTLVVGVLPLFIGFMAVLCSEHWLLPVIGAWKAFAFSYSACGISLAYGAAGWLIRGLLLFSDALLIPALCVFCIRYGSGNRAQLKLEWYAWLLLVAVVGCLDYLVVSPFLVSLF